MREALADWERARADSGRRLAVFDGGALTVADFMQWVTALGPGFTSGFPQQPDSMLTHFARTLGENMLLLKQADSAGMQVTPEQWSGFLAGYRAEIDSLRAAFGVAGSDLTDPAVPAQERARLAALQIEGYWNRIADGSQRPRPVPPLLAVKLRREGRYKVYTAALPRVIELATDLKARADSAAPSRKAPTPTPPAPAPPAPPAAPQGGQ
jgi:hypothetical protein